MIAGILLAAGHAARFGSNKLMHELGGVPVIVHTLSACLESNLSVIHVIVGHERRSIEASIEAHCPGQSRIRLVGNPDHRSGHMSSVKTGLRALDASCTGAMVLLGDMPFVRAEDIDALIDAFARRPGLIAATAAGRYTHPRIIPRALFARFLTLEDSQKGSEIFANARVMKVPIDPRSARDIDCPDDLADA